MLSKGLAYYFIDNEYYFGGDQPYNRIYEDVEKFAFFSKAAIAAMKFIDFQADTYTVMTGRPEWCLYF